MTEDFWDFNSWYVHILNRSLGLIVYSKLNWINEMNRATILV